MNKMANFKIKRKTNKLSRIMPKTFSLTKTKKKEMTRKRIRKGFKNILMLILFKKVFEVNRSISQS